jgi:hypothetical protein
MSVVVVIMMIVVCSMSGSVSAQSQMHRRLVQVHTPSLRGASVTTNNLYADLDIPFPQPKKNNSQPDKP